MGKVLAILTIVAAVVLAILVMTTPAASLLLYLGPLVVVAAAAFCFGEGKLGLPVALVGILVGVVAFLAYSQGGGKVAFLSDIHATLGIRFMAAATMFAPVALAALYWQRLPLWLPIATAVAAIAAFSMTMMIRTDNFGVMTAASASELVPPAILGLATAYIGIHVLRLPVTTVARPSSGVGTVRPPAAAKPSVPAKSATPAKLPPAKK